jgi:citrate lyase beta subunit
VNGKMVDAQFVRRAEAILALARKLNLIPAEDMPIQ